jgi:hypothetical protein
MNIMTLLVLLVALAQSGPQPPTNLRIANAPPPPPPSGSRCPALPSFPDANCTGVIPGTTLTSCSGNVTANSAQFNNCLFSGGVSLNGRTGVRITNSRINGVVSGGGSGLVMTDVEIDGNNSSLDATNGLSGYTCVRCNVHDAAKGFTGSNFTVIDSYVHDIYGSGDSHNEAVLGSTGNITIRHSTLDSRWSSSSSGGGMSACIALYTHGDFWPALNNVLLEQNRISVSGAYYALYAGNSADAGAAGDPSNIHILNNTFVRGQSGSGAVSVGWLRGNGNVWSGNVYSDGVAIPEPATNNYAGLPLPSGLELLLARAGTTDPRRIGMSALKAVFGRTVS